VTGRFLGWRMVAIAFVAQNCAYGFTYGAYGTFIKAVGEEFSAPRTVTATGLALVSLLLGILGPVVGHVLARIPVRRVMTWGLLLLSAAWAAASFARDAWQFALSIGVLGGAGAACLGAVPAMTLVNAWFIEHRGRAAGAVMIPLFVTVVPSIAAAVTSAQGWRFTAMSIAAATLLALPLVRLIVDRPELVGQNPLGAVAKNGPDAAAPTDSVTHPLRRPVFWALMVASGLVFGSAVTMATHIVPYAIDTGVDSRHAALVLSVIGACGMPGAFLWGIVADRIGGARTLALLALTEALAWAALFTRPEYPRLLLLAATIGLCSGGGTPVKATVIAALFGRSAFSRVVGYSTFCMMPFTFTLPLLAARLYDLSGSYERVFAIHAAMFLLAGSVFLVIARLEKRSNGGRVTAKDPETVLLLKPNGR